MRTLIAVLLLAFTASAADRTSEIVASFAKSKHVHKQKRGVTKAKFVERSGEPAAAQPGTYAVQGMDFTLQLAIDAGAVRGSGSDRGRAFELRDGRVAGSLLTATKVYADGTTSPFEGVFMTLVSREGTSPDDATTTRAFGLGVIPYAGFELHGVFVTKLFYERDNVPRS